MIPVSLSDLRASMKAHFDAVTDAGDTLVVRRSGGRSVVLLSLEVYQSLISQVTPSHAYVKQSTSSLVKEYSQEERMSRLERIQDPRVWAIIDQVLDMHDTPTSVGAVPAHVKAAITQGIQEVESGQTRPASEVIQELRTLLDRLDEVR
ncbi:MAG: type II toxin-antitoxin system Phd/YefM family antitoxin [Flavobacteriales bacterium]